MEAEKAKLEDLARLQEEEEQEDLERLESEKKVLKWSKSNILILNLNLKII